VVGKEQKGVKGVITPLTKVGLSYREEREKWKKKIHIAPQGRVDPSASDDVASEKENVGVGSYIKRVGDGKGSQMV